MLQVVLPRIISLETNDQGKVNQYMVCLKTELSLS
jgi:hypothetical protein